MNNYQSPSIMFQEIALFEKIAKDCWNHEKFLFDDKFTCDIEAYELYTEKITACNNNDNVNILAQISCKMASNPAQFKNFEDYFKGTKNKIRKLTRLKGFEMIS